MDPRNSYSGPSFQSGQHQLQTDSLLDQQSTMTSHAESFQSWLSSGAAPYPFTLTPYFEQGSSSYRPPHVANASHQGTFAAPPVPFDSQPASFPYYAYPPLPRRRHSIDAVESPGRLALAGHGSAVAEGAAGFPFPQQLIPLAGPKSNGAPGLATRGGSGAGPGTAGPAFIDLQAQGNWQTYPPPSRAVTDFDQGSAPPFAPNQVGEWPVQPHGGPVWHEFRPDHIISSRHATDSSSRPPTFVDTFVDSPSSPSSISTSSDLLFHVVDAPDSESPDLLAAPALSSSKRRGRTTSNPEPSSSKPPPKKRKKAVTAASSSTEEATPPVPARVYVIEDDAEGLPALPDDFNTYGGESKFNDKEDVDLEDGPPTKGGSKGKGRQTTPDFSGREDAWGIGREAYQKLTAKARKQLRNKIGARRFRERRKEYITTLEARLAERDVLLLETRNRLLSSMNALKDFERRMADVEAAQGGAGGEVR